MSVPVKNGKPSHDGQRETEPLLSHAREDITSNKTCPAGEEIHYKDISRNGFWWLFTTTLLCYLLAFFDSSFMATSHPIITSYFNASNAASWLSTVFFLTSIVFGPLYGRISDVVGRRPPFTFALILFTLTTVGCGAANSIGSLIVARAICGVGAGGVISMSNVILSDIVKIEYRGIYQSYQNLCFGFGNGLGASIGGILCDRLGWRAAFYLQVPILVVLTILAALCTPRDLGPSLAHSEGKTILQAMKAFDFAGAGTLALTFGGLILGINLGGSVLSWTHPLVIAALVIFLVAAIALVTAERRAVRPILPLSLVSTVPFANLNWGNTVGTMLTSTVLFNVPLYLQGVKLVSPTTSGLILLSPLVGVSIVSVLTGYYISWTRRLKDPVVVGVMSILGGIIACGCLTPDIPISAVVFLIPWISVGQGFMFPPTTVSTLALSPDGEQAVVVTTLGLSRSIGGILCIAVSSWIVQNALLIFLRREVTGSKMEKDAIIARVRKSVRAVREIEPAHRTEVIKACSKSLQVMFLSFTVLAIGLCLLMMQIHIPKLQKANLDESNDDCGDSNDLPSNEEGINSND